MAFGDRIGTEPASILSNDSPAAQAAGRLTVTLLILIRPVWRGMGVCALSFCTQCFPGIVPGLLTL
jgi:hypothetical protein